MEDPKSGITGSSSPAGRFFAHLLYTVPKTAKLKLHIVSSGHSVPLDTRIVGAFDCTVGMIRFRKRTIGKKSEANKKPMTNCH